MSYKKAVLILIILILVGTGYYFFVTGLFSSEEDIDRLMSAKKNMSELNSYSLNVDMNFEVLGAEDENLSNLNLAGGFNIDKRKKAMEGDLDLEVDGEAMMLFLSASLIYIEDNLYGRINTLPLGIFPTRLSDNFARRWILLAENATEGMDNFLIDAFEKEGMDPQTVSDIFYDLEGYWSAAWRDGFQIEKIEKTTLNDSSVELFRGRFDHEKMVSTYREVIDYLNFFGQLPELTEEELQEMSDAMKESYRDTEIKIYVKDNYVLRKEIRAEVDSEMPEEINMSQASKTIITTTIDYDNFNKEFEMEAPEDHLIFQNILGDFLNYFPETDQPEFIPEY